MTTFDETNIPDHWWTNGYCSTFALALKRRFNIPIYAYLERAKDGDVTLIHAVGLKYGLAFDANGSQLPETLMAEYQRERRFKGFTYYPGEATTLQFVRISEKRLANIHGDFNPDDVPQALAYIDRNPHLFTELTPTKVS